MDSRPSLWSACARLVVLFLLLRGFLCSTDARAGVDILWPAQAPEWGLLLGPGAQRKPEEYRILAQRIQDESPVPLAVGIASFTANWPEPFQMVSALKSFKSQVSERAAEPLAGQRFLVAGHSMAGIIIQELPAHQSIGGVILLGAYPSNDVLRLGQGLRKAGIPTLVVAGEWDGLTRITRVLDTVLECEGLSPGDPNEKRCAKQRVVILPGVNHSDFANGVLQAGDLEGEVDLETAHTEIAKAIAGYWSDVLLDVPGNFNAMHGSHPWKNWVADTQVWAHAWSEAIAMDERACLEAQRKLLPRSTSVRWDVMVRTIESVPGFMLAKPSIEKVSDDHFRVTAIQSQDRPFNPLDLSLQSRAFTRLSCKLKSEEALRAAAQQDVQPRSTISTCGTLNQEIYNDVVSRISLELKHRLHRRGLELIFGEDLPLGDGLRWATRKPERRVELTERRVVVRLPRLQTPANAALQLDGLHYCQFVPPTQLAEWVFFDAFKLLAPAQ
ncbi:MAG: hypothetical protein FJY29_07015 [Betaproteobacteria bacterium]|nr:hypothetical protein [Betaproteobacteria bacterium]